MSACKARQVDHFGQEFFEATHTNIRGIIMSTLTLRKKINAGSIWQQVVIKPSRWIYGTAGGGMKGKVAIVCVWLAALAVLSVTLAGCGKAFDTSILVSEKSSPSDVARTMDALQSEASSSGPTRLSSGEMNMCKINCGETQCDSSQIRTQIARYKAYADVGGKGETEQSFAGNIAKHLGNICATCVSTYCVPK